MKGSDQALKDLRRLKGLLEDLSLVLDLNPVVLMGTVGISTPTHKLRGNCLVKLTFTGNM